MKKGSTELVCILDKSGSMAGLEKDTIGGFNSMLAKQKAVDGECRITTVLFNHHGTLLHDRIDIRAVSPIDEKTYFVGGSTALLDAIGTAIQKIEDVQAHTAEEFRAENVMFVIITDGEENASRRFSSDKVKALIERKKKESAWEFLFLGANIDAVETAKRFGIAADRAQNYHADKEGVELNYCVMSETVTKFRGHGKIESDWKDAIQKDFQDRKDR